MTDCPDTGSIDDFEGRVAGLRVAHGPGCGVISQSVLAGLSSRHRELVIREALRRERAAKIRREIGAGQRGDHEVFLNNLADALLRLPDGERDRRLARCPKVMREHVKPVIAEYVADMRDFLIQAGIPGHGLLPE